MLMFSIGIELEIRDLIRTGPPALIGTPLFVILTIGVALGVGVAVGLPINQAAAVGIVIAISSSMVAAKLLLERGEINSPQGHIILGTAVMEDLIVVILIAILPVLAMGGTTRVSAAGGAVLRAAVILVPFL